MCITCFIVFYTLCYWMFGHNGYECEAKRTVDIRENRFVTHLFKKHMVLYICCKTSQLWKASKFVDLGQFFFKFRLIYNPGPCRKLETLRILAVPLNSLRLASLEVGSCFVSSFLVHPSFRPSRIAGGVGASGTGLALIEFTEEAIIGDAEITTDLNLRRCQDSLTAYMR